VSLMQRLGTERVVNASGRMTRLGVNTLSDPVIEAMAEGARNYVDIEHLHRQVGKHIAGLLGAEDAMVTSGAAAGVSIMVAATIAGDDLNRVHTLPDVPDRRNKVLIQAGHQVQFGAPINQMIRIGGGLPVPVGQVNSVRPDHLRGSIDEDVVAFVYVKSHHAVQKGMLSLAECIEICAERNLPVLIDAAAEEDLLRYTQCGAAMVTFSGGKAIGGPTSGIIAGSQQHIRACRMQNQGIGRPMKVGKEQLLGLAVAVEKYIKRDVAAESTRSAMLVDRLLERFARIDGVQTRRLEDEAGRGIPRAGILLQTAQAKRLVQHLTTGSPAVYPRTHLVNTGIVAFDPRPLDDGDIDIITERVRSFFDTERAGQ
jgi:D-glucosaminate-6-phosphate ammonia-lyase